MSDGHSADYYHEQKIRELTAEAQRQKDEAELWRLREKARTDQLLHQTEIDRQAIGEWKQALQTERHRAESAEAKLRQCQCLLIDKNREASVYFQAKESAEAKLRASEERVKRLSEALKPFGEALDRLAKVQKWASDNHTYTDHVITTGISQEDWEIARAALSESEVKG